MSPETQTKAATWRQVVETYNAILPSPIKIQEACVERYIDIVRACYRVIYDRMFDRVLGNTKIP